jgi:c-di-GMP-related signal transduction protein
MLTNEYFTLLPPDQVVVEIQDSVPVDEISIKACQQLKGKGYAVALDNFVQDDPRESLIAYTDFIKIDHKRMPPEQIAALALRFANKQCRMIAQNVQTRQDFSSLKTLGFTHFQGYFFRKPEQLRARQIPANQTTYLRLLQALSKPNVDLVEVETLIKREASLCYRLLRYMNSPAFGLSSPVQSIRQALGLLGERQVVRWIRMATTMVMGHTKPSDLVLSSLVRARFCELLEPRVIHGNSDLFLLGMLSLMDAILEAPMGVVTEGLALDPNTKAQLLARKTGQKTPLSLIYEIMEAREAGDWEAVTAQAKKLNLSLIFVNRTYNEAMQWARQITSAV